MNSSPGGAQNLRGIGISGFLAALLVSVVLFVVQTSLFLSLRKRKNLRHVYYPKPTYGWKVGIVKLLRSVRKMDDKEIIEDFGMDAYSFLRYLKTLLVVFTPIMLVAMPNLIVLNYLDGRGQDLEPSKTESSSNTSLRVMGLDTLAFGNVRSSDTKRYTAHLVYAILVVVWFCYISLLELSKDVKLRFEWIRKKRARARTLPASALALPEESFVAEPIEVIPGEWLKVYRNQNTKALEQALSDRDRLVAEFESAATTLVKKAWPGSSPDLVEANSSSALQAKAEDFGKKLFRKENEIRDRIREKNSTYKSPHGKGADDSFHVAYIQPDATGALQNAGFEIANWQNIVWSNIGLAMWKKRLRFAGVAVLISVMIAGWAIPVSATAALSQVDVLIRDEAWLLYLQQHKTLKVIIVSVAGVLPGAALAFMLLVLPYLLKRLSLLNGATCKAQQAAFVQRFYFVFLFVQMFLVVSIASFFTASVKQFVHNLEALQSIESILDLLSQNLPTAANYFFSYMILQALSGSSAIMMQLSSLFWLLKDRIFDSTPRQKLLRRGKMDVVDWGGLFPAYTTLACISLVYSVIAPLISLFATISFSFIWLSQKYSVVHVKDHETDHGGILYSRAVNQTFVGIYVMMLCMAGLFFGVRDETGEQQCKPHGFIMMGMVILTAMFQLVLNIYSLPRQKMECIKELQEKTDNCAGEVYYPLKHPQANMGFTPVWVPRGDFTKDDLHLDHSIHMSEKYEGWVATLDKNRRVCIQPENEIMRT